MRVALQGGSYEARGYAANAQVCLNLYPETNPQNSSAPVPVTHYPTPGLTLLATLPTSPVRGVYEATNGNVYAVAGDTLYALSSTWVATVLGTITPGLSTPVSMTDNGTNLLLVDGTSTGWTVIIATNAFSVIPDPNFVGADRVDYLDTFFLSNVPGTPQFQSSLSNSVTWDALYFANAEASSQLLVSLVVAKREIWLITEKGAEIFYDAGAADFPFASQPGVYVDHGCVAKYSVAQADDAVYWLSKDRQGQGIVLKGAGYTADRKSTFAIEWAISQYSVVSDAIGFCQQQGGHTFYWLTFPTQDVTWCYDVSTDLWHQRCWTDSAGVQHRHRANCAAFAHGACVVGDWQTGAIYKLDPANETDDGASITRQRSFPHMLDDGKRITYDRFIADMTTGVPSSGTPQLTLDWSDDRGATWGLPVPQPMVPGGLTSYQWRRLGLSRDRVFRLTWTGPVDTALNGAFVDYREHDT